MAESILEDVLSSNLTNTGNLTSLDCAVCLQTCIHPAELPCGHIFCYLCIKGIVNQGRRCAMCRQDIPVDYLDKPTLLKPVDTEIISQGFEDGHLWFYEGHNGWWQYDGRTSLELESAYQKGERCCELLIAGFLYVVDFDGMLQYRRNDPSRRRRIKRDIATTTKKGIAGIKLTKNCSMVLSEDPENLPNEINQNLPVPTSPLNGFASLRTLSSGSNNFIQHAESIQGHQRTRERHVSGYSNPTCRIVPTINLNSSSVAHNSRSNYNLDSSIQNTLDWAIEQIESLNLELLNDYETILWDYGQSEGNLNRPRCNRITNNDITYLNVSDSLNESVGIDSESSPALPARNDNVNNNCVLVEPPSVPSDGASPDSSEINETEADSECLFLSPPQPPPRNRGLTSSRSLRDFQQGSSSLSCDPIFQRFVSDK